MDDDYLWIKVEADSEVSEDVVTQDIASSPHQEIQEVDDESNLELSKECKVLTPSPDDTGWIEESDDEEDSGISGNISLASVKDLCLSASKKPPDHFLHQQSGEEFVKNSNLCNSEQGRKDCISDEFNGPDKIQTFENIHTSMCGEKSFTDSSKVHESSHTAVVYSCIRLKGLNKKINPRVTAYRCTVLDKSSIDISHMGAKPAVCKKSKKTLNYSSTLMRHETTAENSHKCKYCGKQFKLTNSLKCHERLHIGEKPYECKYCNKTFNTSNKLQIHERIHTGEKPYECKYCGRPFNQSGSLKYHLRSHTGEKPYECKYCGQLFNRSSSLKKHDKLGRCQKTLLCKYCGKSFVNFGHLECNDKLGTGGKAYKCTYCNKSFDWSKHLKRHERLHTDERPHMCNYCNKSFTCSSALKSHVRLHTGEKPYKCKDCGKLFTQAGSLKNHERLHTGEKPYQCNDCGKAFNRSCSLKRHERLHTGEKPYNCKDCGKLFSQSNGLKKHGKLRICQRRDCNLLFNLSGI